MQDENMFLRAKALNTVRFVFAQWANVDDGRYGVSSSRSGPMWWTTAGRYFVFAQWANVDDGRYFFQR